MSTVNATEDHPLVAAVVLNWNGRDDTLSCLDSLATSDWPKLTTIVVDNASEENIAPMLTERFSDVELLRNSTNLGFAGGMNTGVRRALDLDADFVLLLNNDILVDPAMVRTLVLAARERPDAGIVAPLEMFRDAPEVVSSAGLCMNPRRAYQGRPMNTGERDIGQFRGVREVDVASGAAMLVPATVVREVGYLDEDLYLYVEDFDWALRMRSAGRRVYVALEARVWHGLGSASGGQGTPRVTYYVVRNSYVVCKRHAPMRGPRGVLRHCEILFANLIHAARLRRPLANARAVLAGRRDYLRGRLGPRLEDSPAVPSR